MVRLNYWKISNLLCYNRIRFDIIKSSLNITFCNMEKENNTVTVTQPEEKILKPMNGETSPIHTKIAPLVIILAIGAGILTGWIFGRSALVFPTTGGNLSSSEVLQGAKSQGVKVIGSKDTKTFKDCTKGKLIKNDGKITTEGSHILQREGGESQNVYLTSSIVDLEQFLNKTIEVCGETNAAQKAGWLLDVGLVKVE